MCCNLIWIWAAVTLLSRVLLYELRPAAGSCRLTRGRFAQMPTSVPDWMMPPLPEKARKKKHKKIAMRKLKAAAALGGPAAAATERPEEARGVEWRAKARAEAAERAEETRCAGVDDAAGDGNDDGFADDESARVGDEGGASAEPRGGGGGGGAGAPGRRSSWLNDRRASMEERDALARPGTPPPRSSPRLGRG